jgi:predicted amidohydrolase
MVIESGSILGVQRKINIVPGGAERWSTRGEQAVPVHVGGLALGLLICADAYTPDAARSLRDRGAQILVSAAAWAPYPGMNESHFAKTRIGAASS